MGVVYRGEDIRNETPVAVKSLHPHGSFAQPEILERFQREGQLLRELDHPNIVGMLDAFEEDGRYYLVTEYVAGGDLGQLLEQDKQLSIERSLAIALELADALTRAHHIQIIHRDIKPANVLLAADGTLKLTDFGIASSGRGSRITEQRPVLGTIAYLSPEACLGQELDQRADIWSFGVLLYQMLLGERPFAGENIAATLTSIMGQELPDMEQLRPEIPDGLADLVYRMLVKDRAGRIPSARMVGAELEGLLKGFEVSPRRGVSVFATPTPEARERPIRLPDQSTRFIGREKELAQDTAGDRSGPVTGGRLL
jgi:serine/threonine-protein kinase